MDSGAETEGRIPSRQGDVDFQHATNNKDKLKSGSTPSPFTNWYYPTPSPADSGVMSPLTPLSNYTNVGGPNCTPEQNIASSPEHSINSFAGYPISNGYGSSSISVSSPYNNFNQFVNPSLTESSVSANPSQPCSTIQSCSAMETVDQNFSTSNNSSISTAITCYMTNQDSDETVQNVENNFSSSCYQNCQPLPPFHVARNDFNMAQQNWNDYSRNNFSSIIQFDKNSTNQPFQHQNDEQNENMVRIHDSTLLETFSKK